MEYEKSGAMPYIKELMEISDIVILSKHRLYESELHRLENINPHFVFYSKASQDLKQNNQTSKPGHCGISMCWKKSVAHNIRVIENPSDRICIIELASTTNSHDLIYVFGVYLPQQACRIATFEEHLEILNEYIDRYKTKGEIVIIGDTNCHFGGGIYPRFSGKTTPNAQKLLRIIYKHNMQIVDGDGRSSGPHYTFAVEGVGQSYIDHCICSNKIAHQISTCCIFEETLANTSDHLPIHIAIERIKLNEYREENIRQIAWHKFSETDIQEKYTKPLDQAILNRCSNILTFPQNNSMAKDEIEQSLRTLTKTIIECSVPLQSPRKPKHLKPYWNETLNSLSKDTKNKWNKWCCAGRPRGTDPLFTAYKEAKKLYRDNLRKTEHQFEIDQMKHMYESQEMDQKFFWYMVNKNKKHGQKVYPLKIDNEVITDPDKLRDIWSAYFKALYSEKTDENFNQMFKEHVDKSIMNMEADSFLRTPKIHLIQYVQMSYNIYASI